MWFVLLKIWKRAGKRQIIVNRYPRLYGAVGIHPHETCHATEDSLQELESVARENHKIVAIGEIGLDYHYFYSDKEMQQKWFQPTDRIGREVRFADNYS